MFKRKTVFVVGAGGSKEVGLPVGDELKQKIAVKVDLRFENGYDLSSGDRNILQCIRLLLEERGERDANPHCTAGRIIASAMHQALSIDNYLHTHADDELIVEMGKMGIAATIMEAEKNSKIAIDQHSGDTFNFGSHPDIWHNTFCKMLTEGVQRTKLDSIFDNVSFISFNYDRCIEHYISQWISNYMRVPLDEAQTLTNQLTVIHPYGQIGQLPWQRKGITSVPFGATVDARNLTKIAGHIRTFTEQVDDAQILDRMGQLLAEAQQVVFLGFSYGAMNLELMRLTSQGVIKGLLGTSMGLSVANMRAIEEALESIFNFNGYRTVGSRTFQPSTCNQLLNDYFRPLT